MKQEITETSEDVQKMILKLQLKKLEKELVAEAQAEQRREDSKNEMRKMISKFESDKAAYQAVCNHTSEDNRFTLIGGQVHNDGKYHPFCRRCFKEFPARSPRGTEIDNTVQQV